MYRAMPVINAPVKIKTLIKITTLIVITIMFKRYLGLTTYNISKYKRILQV